MPSRENARFAVFGAPLYGKKEVRSLLIEQLGPLKKRAGRQSLVEVAFSLICVYRFFQKYISIRNKQKDRVAYKFTEKSVSQYIS